jgi:D-amino-acid dehydrogenase
VNTALAPGRTVIVVGGGVVGTSAAYALANAGYEVTLVTAEEIGDGATAGNAGLVVPADSVVWPGPANARAVSATLLGRGGSSIGVSWSNPSIISWGIRFLANSTSQKYDTACWATHALSVHSLAVAEAWAAAGDVGTDLKLTGMLFLLDSLEAVVEVRQARLPLRAAGESYVELTRAELVAMDGAYHALPDSIHAVYTPGAARGDSQAFAHALVDRFRAGGGNVLEGRPVTRLLLRNGRVVGVESAAGRLHADAIILAAGVGTRSLARTVGLRAPILPVKGYAATVPVIDPDRAPDVGGVLESRHVAFSRMGDRLRFSTGAEIGRTDHDVHEETMRLLQRSGEVLFPGALDWTSAEYRAEHRPMTPTGLPMIGPTQIPGLYLDAAHGSLGWTQAAGSADLLTHLIRGTPPSIDPTPFLPTRPNRLAGALTD